MNCDRAAAQVAAHADGEIRGLERVWLEKHLRGCASCATLYAEVLALRQRVRTEAPYYAAPPGLRDRVQASLRAQPAESSPARRRAAVPTGRGWIGAALAAASGERFRWLGSGALAGCAATLFALAVGTAIVDYRTEHDVATQAVAAHVRAALGDRLIEVVSSDQHTVKPWLSARLDYSPPVRDLAALGFPLAGGRLTDLGGHETATLVYRYRKHTIDVYVRPEAAAAMPMRSIRGFNVVRADGDGWDWLIVSDAEPDALKKLAQALVERARAD